METTFGSTYSLRLRWFAILRDWNTLDQYVRLQRLERGLEPLWFERELDSYLQTQMTADKFPFDDFFQVHEGPKDDDSRRNTMWAAYTTLDRTLRGDRVYVWEETFPSSPIRGYMAAVERSVSSMRALANTVGAVE